MTRRRTHRPAMLAAALLPALLQAGPAAAEDAAKAHFEPRLVAAADGGTELVLDATIAPGWILYASDFEQPEIGPRAARLVLADATPGSGGLRSVASRQGHGRSFAGDYRYTYFSGRGELRQSLPAGTSAVKATVQAQVCFEESGLCELVRQEVTAH